jgi:hypothetical protein
MYKLLLLFLTLSLVACVDENDTDKENKVVQKQQNQYLIGQPIPVFDYSLERDLIIQLYQARNTTVSTHTVWRSDYGIIEGDCPSIGYGLPYDTSLTNPTKTEYSQHGLATIDQAEPNGLYASKNTSATWIMCTDLKTGTVSPIYIEGKVTTYPYTITVDYRNNRVYQNGKSNININIKK